MSLQWILLKVHMKNMKHCWHCVTWSKWCIASLPVNFITNDVIVFKYCFAASHITIHCKKTTPITTIRWKLSHTCYNYYNPVTFFSPVVRPINPKYVFSIKCCKIKTRLLIGQLAKIVVKPKPINSLITHLDCTVPNSSIIASNLQW